jgi:hypothetical protein
MAEDGPDENQSIFQGFADETEEIMKVWKKISYSIYASRTIQLVVCGKFT